MFEAIRASPRSDGAPTSSPSGLTASDQLSPGIFGMDATLGALAFSAIMLAQVLAVICVDHSRAGGGLP
jgi:hypothetical protein